MKGLSVTIAAVILLFGSTGLRAASVDRISAETGVPVATLQAERASTGLGWGGLEKAHLLANASGQSFDTIVGKFHGGEGWGKIAHDYGLNLGHVVSNARHSGHAAIHTQKLHGKNAMTSHGNSHMTMGRGHGAKMTSMHGGGHGMHSMGHVSGSHGMGSMGHGGGRSR
jgi:hypothetical protein